MVLNRFVVGASSAILLMLCSGSADAGLMLSETDLLSGAATKTSSPKEKDIVAYLKTVSTGAYSGITDVGDLLFKWEQGAGEEKGTLLDSYNVVNEVDSGRGGVTLEYAPTGDMVASPAWLIVKGGNTGFVTYDLGPGGVDWDGREDLTFTNAGLFKKKDGISLQSISHFQIWGVSFAYTPPEDPQNSPTATVPEPTSAAAWSLGALAFGLITNRRKRNR